MRPVVTLGPGSQCQCVSAPGARTSSPHACQLSFVCLWKVSPLNVHDVVSTEMLVFPGDELAMLLYVIVGLV